MKTFKDLTIGDIIYRLEKTTYRLVPEKDSHGNLCAPSVLSKVSVIDVSKNGDNIDYNKSSCYNSSPFLSIPKKHIDQSTVATDNYMYFADESEYKNKFSDFLIEMINKSEQTVKDKKSESDKFIASVREYYYEILNPSSVKI